MINSVLILIGGYQGSGKSTLIARIQEHYPIEVISKDKIRGDLFSRNVPFNEEFVKIVDGTYQDLFKEALLENRSIVLDNNSHSKRIKEIEANLPALGAQHTVVKVLLVASEHTLIERVRTREPMEGIYCGTERELLHALNSVTYDEDDYDLVIDTEKKDAEEVFEAVKMLLDT